MSRANTFQTYIEVKNKSNELKTSFIKHILLMGSGLLGILISFHNGGILSNIACILFSMSLGFLSLGILLLSIALYESVDVQHKLAKGYWQETKMHLSNELYQPKIVVEIPKRIFIICEKLGYFSMILSTLSLATYGILNS